MLVGCFFLKGDQKIHFPQGSDALSAFKNTETDKSDMSEFPESWEG